MIPLQGSNWLAFTIKHNGLTDRIITDLEVCVAFDPKRPPNPLPKSVRVKALWDTGATNSVITKATADALGLKPTGMANVDHGGGSDARNTYVVNFTLPNKVAVVGVVASEIPHIVGDWGAVVGMDIIRTGDFSITNVNKQTWVTFRIPSIAPIDYVEEANQKLLPKLAKAGRNDPCPCGKTDKNGKRMKFKNCCGA